MKLSEKQKEVIRLMRKGYTLYKNVTYVTLWMNVDKVRVTTFFCLVKMGLIKSVGRKRLPQEYALTKLGKTIDL